MTGEIRLRGLVLPARNRKDLVDVPEDARAQLTFIDLEKVDDALVAALGERRQRGAEPLVGG
jgi:ATP-dependent Lon protease